MSTNPELNFIYESHTPGHALKPVIVLPALTKALKEHCEKNKCQPVSLLEAVYDFQLHSNVQQTFNHVVIGCIKGKPPAKGKGSVVYLIKHTFFDWVFGIPQKEDEYREC